MSHSFLAWRSALGRSSLTGWPVLLQWSEADGFVAFRKTSQWFSTRLKTCGNSSCNKVAHYLHSKDSFVVFHFIHTKAIIQYTVICKMCHDNITETNGFNHWGWEPRSWQQDNNTFPHIYHYLLHHNNRLSYSSNRKKTMNNPLLQNTIGCCDFAAFAQYACMWATAICKFVRNGVHVKVEKERRIFNWGKKNENTFQLSILLKFNYSQLN